MQDTVQRSARRRAPLELTGERTLPDVPAENYWFRRHLAVYEWVASAAAASKWSTWPAARATAWRFSPGAPGA